MDPNSKPAGDPPAANSAELEQLRKQVAGLQAEIERRERNDARVAGMQAIVEAAREAGLNRPEDFARVGEMMRTFKGLEAQGITLQQIQNPEGRGNAGNGGATLDDAMIDRIAERVSARAQQPYILDRHESAERAMRERINSMLDEMAGDNKELRSLLERNVQAELLAGVQDFYPKDHPLHTTHMKPLDDDGFNKLREAMTPFTSVFAAQKAAATGDAARKAAQQTRAQQPSGQGASPSAGPGEERSGKPGMSPSPESSTYEPGRPIGPNRDDVIAELEEMIAAESGEGAA